MRQKETEKQEEKQGDYFPKSLATQWLQESEKKVVKCISLERENHGAATYLCC